MVYYSHDALDFGVNGDDGYYVAALPIAAPEIFRHDGRWQIAALLLGVALFAVILKNLD